MRTDYRAIFNSMRILADRRQSAEKVASKIKDASPAYERISAALGIPWYCIGAIHSLECGLDFTRHLHNGDSLRARTIHVPAGRPLALPARGEGQAYSWDESAIDALKGRWKPKEWGLEECCAYLERYNGMGYWLRRLNSPYLWGATSAYKAGYFLADGVFSPTAISWQVGAGAIWKIYQERGEVAFGD